MKRAIVCYNCGKLKKESESYWVKVVNFHFKDTLVPPDPDLKIATAQRIHTPESKVKICRACTKRAGYKVKVIKKKITLDKK